jgi:hypothetical protein
LRKLVSPSVNFSQRRQNRLTRFEARRSIATGDYITIIENDKHHTIYCDELRNSDQFFKYNANIEIQIANVNDALQRLNTLNIFTAKYDTKSQYVTIECINSAISDDSVLMYADIPDSWYPIVVAKTVPNQMSRQYMYEFTVLSTLTNTLIVNNASINLAQLNIADITYCTILFDRIVEYTFNIVNIIRDFSNNTAIIIFDGHFEFTANATTYIILSMFNVKHIEVCQMQFYDIVNFDNSMKSFNVESKHNALAQLNSLTTSNYNDIIDNVKSQFTVVSDAPAISKISKNSIEFSNNVYDRLKEYDINKFALFNKINSGINKWVSSTGTNSYNLPMSANVSVAYNQANMSTVIDSTFLHDIHSLQYDYFIMGTVALSDTYLYEHTTSTISNVDILKLPNAMHDYFRHEIITQYNEQVFTKYINNFVTTSTKYNIDTKCFALFRGIEYELPIAFVYYKFTIVHISTKNTLTPIVHELINETDKSIIIAIEYPITDTILTNVENEQDLFLSSNMIMRRYIY